MDEFAMYLGYAVICLGGIASSLFVITLLIYWSYKNLKLQREWAVFMRNKYNKYNKDKPAK